jgi:DivIVA domain-containing protein
MRLPDGERSRALLIGTGAYEHLPGVPASRNNLRALKQALQEHTGLPSEHCRTLLDAPDLTAVGRAVVAATTAATDLLLVYYSGHGLVDSDGGLHLALPPTSQRGLPWSGIPFTFLHNAIKQSPAAAKVLVLDCCFSGIATEVLSGGEGTIMGQIRVAGTFTLTSSPANSPAYAFEGMEHTAFTGALLQILEDGSPRAGAMLTLNDLYIELLHSAQRQGLPRPQKCGTHTADMLSLARNRRFAPGEVRPEVAEEPPPAVPIEIQKIPAATPTAVSPAEATAPRLTARDVEGVLFNVVHLMEGYDRNEVDAFLNRVALALAEPVDGPQSMSSVDVRTAEFNSTRMRAGYDMEEVDAFLDLVELEFERRQALAAVTGDEDEAAA